MNIIELKIRYSRSKDWKFADNEIPHSTGIDSGEEKREYNIYSVEETQGLIRLLRCIDRDFNQRFGAYDKNWKYEIIDITFRNGFASGKITRKALDNKIGYQR